MKLNLNKSQLVNLSHDDKELPNELTPQVAGGSATCWTITTTVTVLASHPVIGCGAGGDCGCGDKEKKSPPEMPIMP